MINKGKMVGALKIGGHVIQVFEDPELLLDHEHYGEWQYRELAISIDGTTHKAVQQETLWHEIVEAINEMKELKLKHRQITVLSALLFQINRDNDVNIFLKKGRNASMPIHDQ